MDLWGAEGSNVSSRRVFPPTNPTIHLSTNPPHVPGLAARFWTAATDSEESPLLIPHRYQPLSPRPRAGPVNGEVHEVLRMEEALEVVVALPFQHDEFH